MYAYKSETPSLDFTYPLKSESIREMEKHTKFDAGEEKSHFNIISANFDDIMATVGYPDPELIATAAQKIAAEQMIARTEAEVADFGCGTGLVGQSMNNHGFKKITGIDCSEGMLEIAQDKQVYDSLIQHQLGGEQYMENFPNHLKNKFDFVTAGGLIEAQNFDEKVIQQMLFSLKKGGYMIFSAQYSYIGNFEYHETLLQLEKAGRIQFIEDSTFNRFDKLDKMIGKYTKTPAKIYVYKKTEGDSLIIAKNGGLRAPHKG